MSHLICVNSGVVHETHKLTKTLLSLGKLLGFWKLRARIRGQRPDTCFVRQRRLVSINTPRAFLLYHCWDRWLPKINDPGSDLSSSVGGTLYGKKIFDVPTGLVQNSDPFPGPGWGAWRFSFKLYEYFSKDM